MCCWAGIATLTSELAPTTHRARLLGASNVSKALAGIFGPFVGGLFVNSQPALPLLVFSGVMFCGAIAGAPDWAGSEVRSALLGERHALTGAVQ